MSVTISTTADVAELNALVNAAYRGELSKKGWTTEANLLDGARIDEETITAYLADPNIFILKYTNAGHIKGCVYLESKGDKFYLGMLSVFPEIQAGGIGRLLLQEAETLVKSKNSYTIEITVISTRSELISWYQRRGYVATGELRPFHVDKKFGVPRALIELAVMEKKLSC